MNIIRRLIPRSRDRRVSFALLVVALVTVFAGAAVAASTGGPIDSAGVIHGCYGNSEQRGSHALELQNAGTNCPRHTTAISWSQTGPAGAQGPAGPQGPAGQGLTGIGSNTQKASAATGAPCTVGQIILSASQTLTNGMPANGQVLLISQYQALYNLIGNTYGGSADGGTFQLPNLGSLAPNGMTYSICINGTFPVDG